METMASKICILERAEVIVEYLDNVTNLDFRIIQSSHLSITM